MLQRHRPFAPLGAGFGDRLIQQDAEPIAYRYGIGKIVVLPTGENSETKAWITNRDQRNQPQRERRDVELGDFAGQRGILLGIRTGFQQAIWILWFGFG